MSLPRFVLLVASLFAVGFAPPARADIPPTPQPRLMHLVPPQYAARAWTLPAEAQLRPFPDAPIDVELVEESVAIDLLPTVALVSARFVLRAGERGAPELAVGFPEYTGDGYGKAFVGFAARVDGQPAAAKAEEMRSPVTRADLSWAYNLEGESWWKWTMAFPARATRTVEVTYAQPLDIRTVWQTRSVTSVSYELRGGSVWKGPIGKAALSVRLHGLERAQVTMPAAAKPGAPGEWTWQLAGFEPAEDVKIDIRTTLPTLAADAKSLGPAPYSLDGVAPWLVLLDEMVRFWVVAESAGDEVWDSYIAKLERIAKGEVEPKDDMSRMVAVTFLESLRFTPCWRSACAALCGQLFVGGQIPMRRAREVFELPEYVLYTRLSDWVKRYCDAHTKSEASGTPAPVKP